MRVNTVDASINVSLVQPETFIRKAIKTQPGAEDGNGENGEG
jgi:hypothetical protein